MNTRTTPTPELVALLACPFCGSPPLIDWGLTGRYVGVECSNCGAYGGEQKGIAHDADRKAMELLAITAWNTRAATVPQGVLDASQTAPTTPGNGGVEYWTDAQCLEFASVAFRHARKNLPRGVTLIDIRLGAKRAIDAATTPPPAELGKEKES